MTGGERRAPQRRIAVWDPWVRLVHWSLAVLLPLSWWSAETERFQLHFLSGYAILALVLFRLAWGFVGSETARFGSFLRGPAAALRHFGHLRDRAAPPEIGHNPAGGWMVLLLLGLVLAQATAGLFTDDEVLNRGPLARLVSEGWSGLAGAVHVRVFWVIVACVVLHILAIALYRLLFGRRLVRAMVTGRMDVPPGHRVSAPRGGSAAVAVLLLAMAASLVWFITTLRPDAAF